MADSSSKNGNELYHLGFHIDSGLQAIEDPEIGEISFQNSINIFCSKLQKGDDETNVTIMVRENVCPEIDNEGEIYGEKYRSHGTQFDVSIDEIPRLAEYFQQVSNMLKKFYNLNNLGLSNKESITEN